MFFWSGKLSWFCEVESFFSRQWLILKIYKSPHLFWKTSPFSTTRSEDQSFPIWKTEGDPPKLVELSGKFPIGWSTIVYDVTRTNTSCLRSGGSDRIFVRGIVSEFRGKVFDLVTKSTKVSWGQAEKKGESSKLNLCKEKHLKVLEVGLWSTFNFFRVTGLNRIPPDDKKVVSERKSGPQV